MEHRSLTQGQLLAGEGLVGRPGQKGWDLLIPVCLGPADTLAMTKPRMTFVLVQAKNQIDGPPIDNKYFSRSAFPVSDTATLQEVSFQMEWNANRASSSGFVCKPLSGATKGRANQVVMGNFGAVSTSSEGPGRAYPILRQRRL